MTTDHFDAIKLIVDDAAALRDYISDNMDDVVALLQTLVKKRMARQKSVREYKDRRAEALGVSAHWDYLRNNPVAYQKHVQRCNQRNKLNRAAARSNAAEQNACQ